MESVDFLGTTVKIDTDHSVYTTLYMKQIDRWLYLHYTSAHLPHKKGVVPIVNKSGSNVCTKQIDYNETF